MLSLCESYWRECDVAFEVDEPPRGPFRLALIAKSHTHENRNITTGKNAKSTISDRRSPVRKADRARKVADTVTLNALSSC